MASLTRLVALPQPNPADFPYTVYKVIGKEFILEEH